MRIFRKRHASSVKPSLSYALSNWRIIIHLAALHQRSDIFKRFAHLPAHPRRTEANANVIAASTILIKCLLR